MNWNMDGGTTVRHGKTRIGMQVAALKYLRPVFAAEDGAGGGDDEAAKGIAAALAAKAAADKAAADKAAADKAEADKKAAEEAEKAKTSGLSEEAAKLLKEQMKTKAKLEEATAKLKEFEGIDPVAIRKLLADQAEAEKKALEAKGDFESLKKRMAEEHAAELKRAKDEAAAERTEREKRDSLINTLTIGSAFSNSKFLSDETVLPPAKARLIYGSHFEIENGEVVAFDKPKGEDGRTKFVNSSGEPLAFEEALKRIVEADPDRDQVKRSKLGQGAGSGGDGSGRAKEADKGDKGGLFGIARIQAALEGRAKK